MTFTNITFPDATGDAILVEDATRPMRVACSNSTKPSDDLRWNAVVARDSVRDGEFVFAVASTGVYCRPPCVRRGVRGATM